MNILALDALWFSLPSVLNLIFCTLYFGLSCDKIIIMIIITADNKSVTLETQTVFNHCTAMYKTVEYLNCMFKFLNASLLTYFHPYLGDLAKLTGAEFRHILDGSKVSTAKACQLSLFPCCSVCREAKLPI